MSEEKKKRKSKKWIIIITGIVLLIIIILLFLTRCDKNNNKIPILTIETPQKISISETDEISLDVTISDFGDTLYPAASMSISFDPAYLEFIGLGEGNVFVLNEDENVTKKLPEWGCNPSQCNKSGKINIMYLDTTAGKNAFTKSLLKENDNVVLRLKFRLRGSASTGDVYDLVFEDAVFAASDENESLAMARDTLKVRNSKIVVG